MFNLSDTKKLSRTLREKVGLSESYASQLATGQRTPSLDLAVKIEKATGIRPSVWIERKSPVTPSLADKATLRRNNPQGESKKGIPPRDIRPKGEVRPNRVTA